MAAYEYNIHEAAERADVATLRRLLEDGDSPDALSTDINPGQRKTALHIVCRPNTNVNEGDRVACFKLLRDAGANLEARTAGDPLGSTVLHYAANGGCVEILSLLVEAGVNVNVANKSGYTPLHWAALGDEYIEFVELLLKAGAAVNVRAKEVLSSASGGGTPFDVALKNMNCRVWPLFLRAGAEIPPGHNHPYLVRVRRAGGFGKYAQDHLARITPTFASMLRLPAQPARRVAEFWLHAGYY